MIAGAVYFSLADPTSVVGPKNGSPALVRPVDSNDHIFGNPSARVIIVEYADYDCDFCKDLHTTLHRVITERGANGQVAWVYRQFPLTELHPNAQKHAQAAECVALTAGNDAFWKFSDAMFANQPTDPSRYGALAQSAGAPTQAFQECYVNAESKVNARIAADRANALAAGARGTPYSIVIADGKAPIVMDGAYTEDAVNLILDQVLPR